jgi:hypothetical protein
MGAASAVNRMVHGDLGGGLASMGRTVGGVPGLLAEAVGPSEEKKAGPGGLMGGLFDWLTD